VRLLLGEGRKDESGDFTKGAGLDQNQIHSIINFMTMATRATGEIAKGESLPSNISDADSADWYILHEMKSSFRENPTVVSGLDELLSIWELVRSAGHGIDRICIDPSVVRGLEYYTGPVYEVELLLDTKDEKGRPVRFGSVGGGGRYDGLVSRFRGEPVPATGFSIGVSRLQAALTLLGKIDTKPEAGPVVVLVMDRNEIAQYQKFVTTLRNAGIRTEMYLGNPKNNLGVQFKYADRRNSPCAIIQGGDEKAKGIVQIKDLILGAQVGGEGTDREAFLQKQQSEAQTAVPEGQLVDEVRKVLARHNINWK
jgi:histidyl-tRNA synthetase